MRSPPASRKLRSTARRGAPTFPHRRAAMSRACGPDRRRMPTAPRPGGVAMAAMVSVLSGVFTPISLRLRLVLPAEAGFFELAGDDLLLADVDHVADEPVQHQAHRESQKQD